MIDVTFAKSFQVMFSQTFVERTKREEKKRGESYVYEEGNVKATNLFPYQCGDYVTNWKHGAPIARACPLCA